MLDTRPPVDAEVGHAKQIPCLHWHGAAQHGTIRHGPRLHTIIIWEVGEQNGDGKNPLAAVSILSAGRIHRSSV